MQRCVHGTEPFVLQNLTNNKELIKLLRNRFELLFHLEKELLPPPIHVDQNMFGCLPLRFYNITKDKRYFGSRTALC